MDDINLKIVGKRLQQRRKELKITQEMMGEELKITTFFISRIENGKSNVSFNVLSEICHYLQIKLVDILKDSSPSEENYLESDFIEIFRKLNINDKEVTIEMMEIFLKRSAK